MDLVFVLHHHQPVGNPPDLVDRFVETCYRPFLETLDRFPEFRVALHYSIPLLEHFQRRAPDLLERIRVLADRGQVEILTGGFGEPILGILSNRDRMWQIEAAQEAIKTWFGVVPTGFWLSERAWFPDLPETLAACGIEYLVLDEFHARAAGVPENELHRPYLTEYRTARVGVLFGSRRMRYLIPFRPWKTVNAFLKSFADQHPDGVLVYADDGEKFGGWPGTRELVFKERGLERLIRGLRRGASRFRLRTPGEVLRSRPPRGVIFIPSTTYDEMQEWLLPAAAWRPYRRLQDSTSRMSGVRGFVRTGDWQAFLHRYPEAYAMYRRMMALSKRLPMIPAPSLRRSLMEAQCNDAYWHGVFAGVYAPHLRRAVVARLLQLGDCLFPVPSVRQVHWRPVPCADVHALTPFWDFVIAGDQGGEAVEWYALNPTGYFGQVMARRAEWYHEWMQQNQSGNHGAGGSIHEQVPRIDEKTGRWMVTDAWPRYTGIVLVLESPRPERELLEAVIFAPDASGFLPVRPGATAVRTSVHDRDVTVDVAPAGNENLRFHRRWWTRSETATLGMELEWDAPPGLWGVELQIQPPYPGVRPVGNASEISPGPVADSGVYQGSGLVFRGGGTLELELRVTQPDRAAWLWYPVNTVHFTERGPAVTFQGYGVILLVGGSRLCLHLQQRVRKKRVKP